MTLTYATRCVFRVLDLHLWPGVYALTSAHTRSHTYPQASSPLEARSDHKHPEPNLQVLVFHFSHVIILRWATPSMTRDGALYMAGKGSRASQPRLQSRIVPYAERNAGRTDLCRYLDINRTYLGLCGCSDICPRLQNFL